MHPLLRHGLMQLLVAAMSIMAATPAAAIELPPGFSEEEVGSLWTEPVGLVFDPSPAGANRIYAWERAGRAWVLENGTNSFVPLLDIRDEVGAWRDYGMLGFALDPNFQQNGYIYVSYVVDRHHLMHAGKPSYDPTANDYLSATIGRVTRYTARASDGRRTVDPASRKVLIGETISTGIPILHGSHGPGNLMFGTDGTLLVAVGDAASWEGVDDGGSDGGSYAPQGLIDGIIQPKEDVGAFRSQMVDSLSGKVLRLDPATGDGVASNPFFDPQAPRAAKSRVWALGLRNPYRMTLRPSTGSHLPAEANPGVIVLGDVGWEEWEEVHVIDGPGQN
ncbi:MAG TPA: PQQ-dependent sugar dehydrogenase, partial [Chthoniobacteraceae bacterium]